MSAERVTWLLNDIDEIRSEPDHGRRWLIGHHVAELRDLLSTAAAESEKLREHVELVCRERDLLREEVRGLRASGVPAES